MILSYELCLKEIRIIVGFFMQAVVRGRPPIFGETVPSITVGSRRGANNSYEYILCVDPDFAVT